MIENRMNDSVRKYTVISQPMYFPWYGLLEQVRLSEVFVFYDDVQFARGFFNRVQVKTEAGIRWMTVPLLDLHRGQLINEVRIDNSANWKRSHRDLLRQAYRQSPYLNEMLELVDEVFSREYQFLGELSISSTTSLINYFGLDEGREFCSSSQLGVPGQSSRRLIDLCLHLGKQSYLTGHGARNYLEHESFEEEGIRVDYIDYGLKPYAQLHGAFTPYVTALDLVANCGKDGLRYITGQPVHWRTFTASQT